MSVELTQQLADEILNVAVRQLETSKNFKRPRMERIKEFEDMYLGIVPKSLRNPFNDDFGFMGGFVDNILADTDDPPIVRFGYQDLADAKSALRITAAFDTESKSILPNAQWALKDRWAKRLACFSGRGVYRYYAESEPEYKGYFDVVDHYDFHFEPDGGGLIDNHLFCGEEGIFRTKEQLLEGARTGYYDLKQVGLLVNGSGAADYKEVADEVDQRNNRSRGLGLDPVTNNYTGQQIYKLVSWFTTYQGKKWHLIFDSRARIWLRVKPLEEVFASGLWPYASFATHEDPRVFLSKAPADTAFPIGKNINKFLNQELYNREKINLGREFYDPTMIYDLEALINPGPDRKVPVDTKNGQRRLDQAVFKSADAELSGTIDLVTFLDAYGGRKSGTSPGSEGQAPKDQKVGIFFGELQQIKNRLGTLNKSYREAWQAVGLRYVHGLDEHLRGEIAVRLVGEGWGKLTRADLKRNRSFDITITGGAEEDQLNELVNQKKGQALGQVQTVNPRWKDRQILKSAGFKDDEIKEAYDAHDGASLELMSEAAQAVEDIKNGKKVKMNRGANAAFIQKIIDLGNDMADDISDEQYLAIMAYAEAHADIAVENEKRTAAEMIRAKAMASLAVPNSAPVAPPKLQTSTPVPNSTVNIPMQ